MDFFSSLVHQHQQQPQPLNTFSNGTAFGNSDFNGDFGNFNTIDNGGNNMNGNSSNGKHANGNNGVASNHNHKTQTGPEWQQYRSAANNYHQDDGTVSDNNSISVSVQYSNGKSSSSTPPHSRSNTPGAKDEPLAIGDVDTAAVDEMLSRELADMSFKDRNAINEEVHGVRCLAAVETQSMLEKALWLFQMQVQRVELKPAYDHAVYQLQSKWVMQDPTLSLRCLRAERFDVVKAVRRYIKYLDLIQEYYGDEALLRPIKMSDLGKEEMELLRKGEYQLLPFRDRSGRRIIACLGDAGMKFSLYARMKFFIYFWWVAGEDIETQQRGLVSVFWPQTHNFPDKREAEEAERVFKAVPIRITCLHQCLPDTPAARLVKAVVSLSLDVESRTRMKFHTGEEVEVSYQLMSYGIPVDLIPKTGTGKIKLKNFQQWIKTRKVIEETKEDQPIECPGMNDVIFRFGKSYLSHPGNATFRGLIEANFEEHNKATTTEAKVAVTWRVLEDVENRGGRFLVWDKRGWWTVATDRSQIRSKVAVSLKEHKKRVVAHKNVQLNTSSTYQFERQDGGKRKRAEDGTEPSKCFCVPGK